MYIVISAIKEANDKIYKLAIRGSLIWLQKRTSYDYFPTRPLVHEHGLEFRTYALTPLPLRITSCVPYLVVTNVRKGPDPESKEFF